MHAFDQAICGVVDVDDCATFRRVLFYSETELGKCEMFDLLSED